MNQASPVASCQSYLLSCTAALDVLKPKDPMQEPYLVFWLLVTFACFPVNFRLPQLALNLITSAIHIYSSDKDSEILESYLIMLYSYEFSWSNYSLANDHHETSRGSNSLLTTIKLDIPKQYCPSRDFSWFWSVSLLPIHRFLVVLILY